MPPKLKAAGGTQGDKDDVEVLAKRMQQVSVSHADNYFGHPIHGVQYKRGRSKATAADARPAGCAAWHSDAAASYPPEFTQKTIRLFPQAVAGAAGGGVRVRWGSDEAISIEEWNAKVTAWASKYPNVKDQDGDTPHETKEFRGQQTNKPEIVRACWEALPNQVPSRYTGYARAALNHFKSDRYGNVVCLRETVPGGRANDGALSFFDVDHIFPWSRGGRSRMDNFEAVQCSANRAVKCDNMVQMLNPRDMNCGMRYEQLIAMVDFVLQNFNDERNTTHSWLEKVVFWLTKSPDNGNSFSTFQDDVGHTNDGQQLVQYFLNRDADEAMKAISGGAVRTSGTVVEKADGKATGKVSPPPPQAAACAQALGPAISTVAAGAAVDKAKGKKSPSPPPRPSSNALSRPLLTGDKLLEQARPAAAAAPPPIPPPAAVAAALPPTTQAAGAHAAHPRPRGRAPKGANGVDKMWDSRVGAWVEAPAKC